jgi:serine/threonine protein kinase
VIKDENHKDKIIHCVFEYCPTTLGKFIVKHSQIGKPLPLERIQDLMRNLLTAIDIMHGKMILHRDIKPDNILMDHKCNSFLH